MSVPCLCHPVFRDPCHTKPDCSSILICRRITEIWICSVSDVETSTAHQSTYWCVSSNTGQFCWISVEIALILQSESFEARLTLWFFFNPRSVLNHLKLEAPCLFTGDNREVFGLFWRVVLIFTSLYKVRRI